MNNKCFNKSLKSHFLEIVNENLAGFKLNCDLKNNQTALIMFLNFKPIEKMLKKMKSKNNSTNILTFLQINILIVIILASLLVLT